MPSDTVSGSNPKLTRLEILLHTTMLPDHYLRISDRFDANISLALVKLKTIFLDGLCDSGKHLYVSGEELMIHAPGYYLSRFLAKATNLEHLRLNFQSYLEDATEKVLVWLADARGISMSATTNVTTSLELANVRPARKHIMTYETNSRSR